MGTQSFKLFLTLEGQRLPFPCPSSLSISECVHAHTAPCDEVQMGWCSAPDEKSLVVFSVAIVVALVTIS